MAIGGRSFESVRIPGATRPPTACTGSLQSADVAFVGRWAISNLGAIKPADVVFADRTHEIFDCFLDADGSTLISY